MGESSLAVFASYGVPTSSIGLLIGGTVFLPEDLLLKISNFDFLTLRLSLFAASHSAILDSSALRILAPSSFSLCEKNRLVSSAKR